MYSFPEASTIASREQSSRPPNKAEASSIHFLYLSWTGTSSIATSPRFVFQFPLRDFLLIRSGFLFVLEREVLQLTWLLYIWSQSCRYEGRSKPLQIFRWYNTDCSRQRLLWDPLKTIDIELLQLSQFIRRPGRLAHSLLWPCPVLHGRALSWRHTGIRQSSPDKTQ